MTISGFLTYSFEALYFINDPINIENVKHKYIYIIIESIYNILVILSFIYLIIITIKI